MSQIIDTSLEAQFDRLPPHSIEAEMCLLGSLLAMADKSIIAKVRAVITRESFYQADHQAIYESIISIIDKGAAVDALSVRESLKSRQLWEECGGAEYFARIVASAFTPVFAERYAKTIREKELLRAMISLGNKALRDAYAPSDGTIESAASALRNLATSAGRIASGGCVSSIHRIGDLMAEVVRDRTDDDLDEYIETGIAGIDDLIGGFWLGQKTIIAGRPSMGKSTMIRQFALNLASRGVPVGIISIEEGELKIARNALANFARIANSRINRRQYSMGEAATLKSVAADKKALPMFICDSARKISQIVGTAHALVSEYGVRAVFIDHLHLIDAETDRNREQEISRISSELKWCWKELGIAGIEAAQLNRPERGTNPRPQLTSLRDSGSLEQDSDIVILLHREDYYRRHEPGYIEDGILEADVAKNRDNPTGTVPLEYDRSLHLIQGGKKSENWSPFDHESAPATREFVNAADAIDLAKKLNKLFSGSVNQTQAGDFTKKIKGLDKAAVDAAISDHRAKFNSIDWPELMKACGAK